MLAIGFSLSGTADGIIPIGAAGLVLITTYTGWINTRPLLCLISPGLGFGFLMVGGTYFVLAGTYAPLPWIVATYRFSWSTSLAAEPIPGYSGRHPRGPPAFPIAYGTQYSSWLYAGFALATVAVITLCVMMNYFPTLSLIALLPMPLAYFAWSAQ